MEKKFRALIIILVLVFIYGVYYFAIPALLNRPQACTFLEKTLKDEFGYKIKLENPHVKMGFLPAIWLKADNFSIVNPDGTPAFSVDKPVSKVELIPFIIGRVEVDHFSAKKIDIYLVFDKNSQLKLGQYPIVMPSDSKLNIGKTAVKLGDYNVYLTDEKQNKKITLDGDYFNLDEFTQNKRIKFSTEAKLYVGQKASDININVNLKLPLDRIAEDQLQISGNISDLNLADFSAYAKSLSKNKIKSLSGLVNYAADTHNDIDGHKKITTRLTINDLAVMMDDKASSIYCNGKLDVKSIASTIKNGIALEDMRINAKGIDTLITGTITDLQEKFPVLDMNVTINKSRMENFIPLLPGEENLLPEVNLYKLKKYGYYGDITGNLKIKGRADIADVTGNILSTDGYIIQPLPNNPPRAVIKLKFNGQTMDMDVTVPATESEKVFVKGSAELYGKKLSDLHITSTKNIPLKIAQTVLNPLHEVLNFDLGPVPIMDIRGIGNINLHVTGNRADPHGWGEFNFRNTSASFLEIHNMTLEKGYGSLTFDNQDTHFYTTSAQLKGKPVTVDGVCNLLGVLDFDVTADGQDLGSLLKVVQTSPMLADIQKMLAPIIAAKGNSNFKLKLTGTVKDINDVVFNKNIFVKGSIEMFSDDITLKDLPSPITKVSGKVNFDNLNADFKLSSQIENSRFFIDGNINDNICTAKIVSDKFIIGNGAKFLPNGNKIPFKNDLNKIAASFSGYYNGSIEKVNPDKVSLKGKIYSNKGSSSAIIVDNGTFEINNGTFKLDPLKGTFKGSPYMISANIAQFADNKRKINGNFNIQNLNLANIKGIKFEDFLPPSASKQFSDIKELSGTVSITGSIRNNNTNILTDLNETTLIYGPKNLKIKVMSGNTRIKNDILYLDKVNAFAGEMPIFIDGKISDIDRNPYMDVYVSTKPTQIFFDKFVNNNTVYPIKVKGDIIYTAKLSGTQNNLSAKSELKIDAGSSLYYMGSSLGDSENPVKIYIDNNYTPSRIRINNFKYDKIISSQNNKNFVNNMLNASGTISFLPNNNFSFHNFKVKTEIPTDAKIFNIIFRKPFMKQGLFTSNLIINGNALSPHIIGKLEVTSIDMPFFDATIKDIGFDFKPDIINITSKGVVLTNDLNFTAVMKNKLTPPFAFDSMKLQIGDLNVNKITDMLRDSEAESLQNQSASAPAAQPIDFSRFTIKNAEILADKIQIKNISATDFSSTLNLNDKMTLNVDKFRFKIAEGTVEGKFEYNFLSHSADFSAHMQDANAQIMSEALFDLKGQVYGSVTGDVTMLCNGKSHESCMQTLKGSGNFTISHGKMPKLGSLEYLLKAGNLVQSGITGLSINGIIDLITPLKTGEFDKISGNIHLTDGIADVVNVYSDGKDLNMYLTGSYNLTNAIADMQIFGSLSKDITTVFGKIKNASLNTLLNTIPGLSPGDKTGAVAEKIGKIPHISEHTNSNRIFVVDIYGDINGDNYVKSFKWVK